MNQFEYIVLDMDKFTSSQIQEILNGYGNHGWIMWHLDQFRIIFFREKPPSVENLGRAQATVDVNNI